ncbi:IucA/IucC family protein [Elstera litoralis]|uniref:IucA/IucC family protein n=1 Tax=Elstera litoralis TaxID=552518 RepID=UPI000A84FD0F|nr:IucA/IucC family protein [Elstera litoralis]
MRSSQAIAEQVTFQSFANCYLREIDPGTVMQRPSETGEPLACVEWGLPSQRLLLQAELLSPSRCGPCRFGRIWQRRLAELGWQEVEPFSAVYLLARECYRPAGGARDPARRGHELELLLRVLQSYQSVQRYLEAPVDPASDPESFIAAEQSLVFGHWLHPTPKSLQGMTDWQMTHYAPELHGQFRLHLFAVDSAHVAHASAVGASAPTILADVFGEAAARLGLRPGEQIIPMHPLQAEALLLDPAIQALQAAGVFARAGAGRAALYRHLLGPHGL